jgi:histidine triad (HIT) family protein
MKLRLLKIVILLGLGIGIGAFLFSDTQPRTFLEVKNCSAFSADNNCLSGKELLGLLASIGIQKFPSVLPEVVLETSKTVVLKHPKPETPIHYLIIPKKDIKNIGEISEQDQAYIMDAFAVIRKIAQKEGLFNYQIITNGPGQQQVTYLHFHLMAFPKKLSE